MLAFFSSNFELFWPETVVIAFILSLSLILFFLFNPEVFESEKIDDLKMADRATTNLAMDDKVQE